MAVCAQDKIILNGQRRKYVAPFRHKGNPQGYRFLSWKGMNLPPLKDNGALLDGKKPDIAFRRVDLPEPFGPIRVTISPSSMWMEIFLRTRRFP
jgi:hypothetical protein